MRNFRFDDFNNYEENFGNPFRGQPRGFQEELTRITNYNGGSRPGFPRGGTVTPPPPRPPRVVPNREPIEEISHLPI